MASKSHPTAKKAVPSKKAAPAKKAAAASSPGPGRPKVTSQKVTGFSQAQSGIFVPTILANPVVVPANKFREGIEDAHVQIKKTLQGFVKIFTQEFEVSEISLTLSFNAEGKFLGFGAGGEMSVTVKIVPSQDGDA